MAELKIDWSACVVSGGAELINRVEAARGEYSAVCAEYFDYLVSKAGKTGVHGDRFEESACGFLLLDNLLKKNGIDRRELAIARDAGGRPCVINRSDIDFSISHSEGAALCCIAIGADASVGADIQRVREIDPGRIEELAKAFMEQRELHMLHIAGGAEKISMFYREWTRRESCFKRCGQDELPLSGIFRTGIISACGETYYYSISLPENDD